MKLILLTAALIAAVAIAGRIAIARRRSRWQVANIAEGVSPTGKRTMQADAVGTARNLFVKIGSDSNHYALAGTADIALGVIGDQADAIDDPIAVDLLGVNEGTKLITASAAIAAGDMLVTAANGQARTLPATTGTYYIIGRAIEAAGAAGDVIQFVPCFPIQRVVP